MPQISRYKSRTELLIESIIKPYVSKEASRKIVRYTRRVSLETMVRQKAVQF